MKQYEFQNRRQKNSHSCVPLKGEVLRLKRHLPTPCSDVPILPDVPRVGAVVVEGAGVADVPLLPTVLSLSYLMVPGLELSL